MGLIGLNRFCFHPLVLLCVCGSCVFAGEPEPLELDNEVVCRINTEAVSKRDVEDRMEEIPFRIRAMRDQLKRNSQLTKEAEDKLDAMYREPFRDALRKIVRDRLMLQHAKIEKVTIDDKRYDQRYQSMVARLRSQGVFGGKGFTAGEVQKRIREQMTLEQFKTRFYNILEQPSRPEVQKHYDDNITKYQRKAGVKVRIIRVDRFVSNKFTGAQSLRENAYELAEEWRKDIAEYGGDFKEIARARSDDPESRARDGLILLDPKDPFIDADAYSAQLGAALRGVEAGNVTKVFEFGKASWAIAQVVERREAGAAPLDGDLYEQIYNELLETKTKKKEDDWFRKTLAKSLVTHVVEGAPKTLALEFFFPDDAPASPASVAKPKDEKKQ